MSSMSDRPSAELLARARRLKVDVKRVLEAALENAIHGAELPAEQARQDTSDEAAAAHYNAFIAEHGLFGEEFRTF